MHIEFLLEEPSAEAFLREFLPRVLPETVETNFIVFQGKSDLLKNLKSRLKAYRKWIPTDWRIVVLVDEDRADCRPLKRRMEKAAVEAGFATKSRPDTKGGFVVVNRLAVEEIEAWFFGDVPALGAAFPRVSPNLGEKAAFRNPDAIAGGTWEALERVLKQAGHFAAGFEKITVARTIGAHVEPARNTSRSFQQFMSGLAALAAT